MIVPGSARAATLTTLVSLADVALGMMTTTPMDDDEATYPRAHRSRLIPCAVKAAAAAPGVGRSTRSSKVGHVAAGADSEGATTSRRRSSGRRTTIFRRRSFGFTCSRRTRSSC